MISKYIVKTPNSSKVYYSDKALANLGVNSNNKFVIL